MSNKSVTPLGTNNQFSTLQLWIGLMGYGVGSGGYWIRLRGILDHADGIWDTAAGDIVGSGSGDMGGQRGILDQAAGDIVSGSWDMGYDYVGDCWIGSTVSFGVGHFRNDLQSSNISRLCTCFDTCRDCLHCSSCVFLTVSTVSNRFPNDVMRCRAAAMC